MGKESIEFQCQWTSVFFCEIALRYAKTCKFLSWHNDRTIWIPWMFRNKPTLHCITWYWSVTRAPYWKRRAFPFLKALGSGVFWANFMLGWGSKIMKEMDKTRWWFQAFPWKSKTKQRMAFRMIQIKDSPLPMGKVWFLDFLGFVCFHHWRRFSCWRIVLIGLKKTPRQHPHAICFRGLCEWFIVVSIEHHLMIRYLQHEVSLDLPVIRFKNIVWNRWRCLMIGRLAPHFEKFTRVFLARNSPWFHYDQLSHFCLLGCGWYGSLTGGRT